MSEVWFYQLQTRRLEQVLPPLLERVRKAERRAVVRCGSEARVEDLNRLLWVYREDGFLPHGSAADGFAERQPIYLTAGLERPNAADMLFLVDRAEAELTELPDYARTALIFEGGDPPALAAARGFWKAVAEAGLAAAYWAENERGGWDKKAENAAKAE